MIYNANEFYEIASKKKAEIKAEREARSKEWASNVVKEKFYPIAEKGQFIGVVTAPKELEDCVVEIYEYFESLGFKVTKDTRTIFRVSWWKNQENNEWNPAK